MRLTGPHTDSAMMNSPAASCMVRPSPSAADSLHQAITRLSIQNWGNITGTLLQTAVHHTTSPHCITAQQHFSNSHLNVHTFCYSLLQPSCTSTCTFITQSMSLSTISPHASTRIPIHGILIMSLYFDYIIHISF